jgi:hypothetical protein
MPRLFALDHNFPEPIIEVLSEVSEGGEADLVSVSDIDPRMADLERLGDYARPPTTTSAGGTG